MGMTEKLTARRAELQNDLNAAAQQLRNLDDLRTQGQAQVQQLMGAIQILDELLAEPAPAPVTENPEPSGHAV